MIIRPIRIEDAAGFQRAVDSVCRERLFLATFESPPIERTEKFVENNISSGFPQIIAEENGQIVGWCDAIPGAKGSGSAHVGQLGMGVIAGHRGRKIGSALLEHTIVKAVEFNLQKIELSVYSKNLPAIALYLKFGFEREGLRKNGRLADGVYDDVILMGLDLQTAAVEPLVPGLQARWSTE